MKPPILEIDPKEKVIEKQHSTTKEIIKIPKNKYIGKQARVVDVDNNVYTGTVTGFTDDYIVLERPNNIFYVEIKKTIAMELFY